MNITEEVRKKAEFLEARLDLTNNTRGKLRRKKVLSYDLQQYADQVASLTERAEKARICEWCGGTDLVCYKGHMEAVNKLREENAALKKLVEEATDTMTKDALDALSRLKGEKGGV